MTPAVATMVAAIVGVLGTLCAPLVSQRIGVNRRREERATADRKLAFDERRAAYVAINQAAREFHDRLKYAVHRLRDGVYTERIQADLEDSRLTYRSRYAEAQMIVPSFILDACRDLNKLLTEVDAAVKRIVEGKPRPGESAENLRVNQLKAAESKLSYLASAMRTDLGIVNDVPPESGEGTTEARAEHSGREYGAPD